MGYNPAPKLQRGQGGSFVPQQQPFMDYSSNQQNSQRGGNNYAPQSAAGTFDYSQFSGGGLPPVVPQQQQQSQQNFQGAPNYALQVQQGQQGGGNIAPGYDNFVPNVQQNQPAVWNQIRVSTLLSMHC